MSNYIEKTMLDLARARIREILSKNGKPQGTVIVNFRHDKESLHLEVFEAAHFTDTFTPGAEGIFCEGKEIWKGTI